MNDLKEKIITIKEPTNLNPQDNKPVNFKDENGDKYVLWKTSNNEDGSKRPSVAYSFFQNLPYGGDGQTVGIAYVEEPKTFTNKDGKQIQFTQRTVRVIKDPSGVKPENQRPNTVSQPAPSYQAPKPLGRDFEKEAFGKCKFGFLIEAYKLGKTLEEAEVDAERWTKSAMRVMTGQNTSLGQTVIGQTPQATSPVPEQLTPPPANEWGEEDDVKIENIPF